MNPFQPKGYVDTRYLQAAAELFAPIKRRSYALMQAQAGQTVLDVGCGPGPDTAALAQLVGPTGRVVGIDHDARMLAEANRHAKQAGLGECVLHQQGEATALALACDCFDACRSERLFEHLPNPAAALQEMVRVTRPGGRIVVADMDWGTMSVDTREVDIERRLARARAERMLHSGYVGRQLYRLFRQCKLADLAVEMFPLYTTDYLLARYLGRLDKVEQGAAAAGMVTEAEIERWRAALEQAHAAGTFFASVSVVMVVGRKP